MVYKGHRKMVLLSSNIQLPLVYAKSPSDHLPHWKKLDPLIRHHYHTSLFRYTLNRTHATTICNRVDDYDIKPLDDLLFYFLLHRLVQSTLILNTWFLSGMSWTLWEQIPEEIPIMSVIVHPMAF